MIGNRLRILIAAVLLFGGALNGEAPSCFREIARDFFRADIVSQALSIQNVAQSNWAIINYELELRASEIPQRIRTRANQLIPNPLEPYDPIAAQALLEEVLQQVLAETLVLFHIDSRAKIGEIYGFIKEKQIDKFNRCFSVPPVFKP